jgi:hypothetical protein
MKVKTTYLQMFARPERFDLIIVDAKKTATRAMYRGLPDWRRML